MKGVGINVGGSGAAAVRMRPMLVFQFHHGKLCLPLYVYRDKEPAMQLRAEEYLVASGLCKPWTNQTSSSLYSRHLPGSMRETVHRERIEMKTAISATYFPVVSSKRRHIRVRMSARNGGKTKHSRSAILGEDATLVAGEMCTNVSLCIRGWKGAGERGLYGDWRYTYHRWPDMAPCLE